MNNKNKISIGCILLFSVFISSCSSNPTSNQTWEVDDKFLVERTDEKGSVSSFKYITKDYYLNSGKTEEKTCNVYLPYNYDNTKQYNILYLIHGTDKQNVNHINTWFETIKARVMLDNMIYYKIIDPIIVVAPTFYSYKLYGDDNITNIKDYSPVKANSNENFKDELRYDIIPNIEKEFSTYANSSSEEDLKASRDHRAIAGLSNGCRLTLKAGIVNNYDYFSYFGCFSSSIDSKDIIASLKSDKYKELKLNYMFNSDGIFDFAYNSHKKMVDELLKDDSHIFTENNTEYVKINMGYHSNRSWRVGLYDSLLKFFKVTA